ncbi:hypothetical protein UlMin_022474 [Ulmus minor]
MGKEESPKITRRTTRYSTAAVSNHADEMKESDTHLPTLNDLFHGEEKPISLEVLLSNFPGRRVQILELLRILGPVNCPMLPLFIYGDTSTGKTSIILEMFRHLNYPFVYSSCLTCYSPRILFESVLNQLLLHRKNTANGYSSAKRCERPSDFVNFLREALVGVISNLQGNLEKSGSKKLGKGANGNMIYLIFDNLELVREWDKSSTLLPFLLNLYDILKMPEVGLIFISNASPDTYYSSMGYVEPTPLYFSDYAEEDIRQIFMKDQENKKLYSSFLEPSEKSLDQKENAEQELLMKGPGTFPLERLLAIFQCITSVGEGSLEEEEQGNDGLEVHGVDSSLMSDVLLQLSSLCNANFIVKGASCPLEGSTRYRSTIYEDIALKVARSLKFPLSKYLYRR